MKKFVKPRCAICGKVMQDTDEVAKVEIGTLQNTKIVGKSSWGIAHRKCFMRAFPSPLGVLEEIRRLAEVAS